MNNWKKTTLGEVVEIIDGDRGNNYPKNDEFLKDGYCLFLNTKNVPNTNFSFKEKMFINKEKDNILRKGKLQRHDYILTTRGTIGNFAFYSDNIRFENIRINSGMVIFRVGKNIDVAYLGCYLKSYFFQHQVQQLTSGTAQPQLPIRDLKIFNIILPSISEQKAIAKVLSSLDDKIELLRKQNETLEKIAQTIFKRWFVEFEVDGKKLKVKNGIPEGWRVGCFSDIAEVTSGKRPDNISDKKTRTHKIPLIGATKIMGYVEEFIYNKDILIIGRVGTHGIVQIYSCPIWPSDNTLVIKSDNFIFTYQILKSIDYVKMNRGAVQPLITQTDLKNYPVILPDKNLFTKFKAVINPTFEKIKNNNNQIQTLSRLRDTLLPKLMSGEVRVK